MLIQQVWWLYWANPVLETFSQLFEGHVMPLSLLSSSTQTTYHNLKDAQKCWRKEAHPCVSPYAPLNTTQKHRVFQHSTEAFQKAAISLAQSECYQHHCLNYLMSLIPLFLGLTQISQCIGGIRSSAPGCTYGQLCRTWTCSRSVVLLARTSQQFPTCFDKAKDKASHKYSHMVEKKMNCFTTVWYMSVLCFTIQERFNNCCLLSYVAFSPYWISLSLTYPTQNCWALWDLE